MTVRRGTCEKQRKCAEFSLDILVESVGLRHRGTGCSSEGHWRRVWRREERFPRGHLFTVHWDSGKPPSRGNKNVNRSLDCRLWLCRLNSPLLRRVPLVAGCRKGSEDTAAKQEGPGESVSTSPGKRANAAEEVEVAE